MVTTRAAILRDAGRARPYGESQPLVLETIDTGSPGPGEVLVQIAYAGICHSDLSVVNGQRKRDLPLVLGHEASGVVQQVGANVQRISEGDHVVFSFVPPCGNCPACAIGRPALCEPGSVAGASGTLISGQRRFRDKAGQELNHHSGVSAFSQFVVAAQESLIVIDPQLPLKEAALFGCAVVTGVGAILNSAQPHPGSSVAVFGLGGVGLSAVMGARLAGASTIVAVDVLDQKLDVAKRLGATHLVNSSQVDAIDAIRDITRGGVEYALESVGDANVLAQAYAATRRGGSTITVGLPHPDSVLTIPALGLVADERTLRGSYMGSAVPQRDVPRYIALYQAGLLPVDQLLSGTLPLTEINTGIENLASSTVIRQMVDMSA